MQLPYIVIHSYKKILFGGHIVSSTENSGAVHIHPDPSIPELRMKLFCGLIGWVQNGQFHLIIMSMLQGIEHMLLLP